MSAWSGFRRFSRAIGPEYVAAHRTLSLEGTYPIGEVTSSKNPLCPLGELLTVYGVVGAFVVHAKQFMNTRVEIEGYS